MDTSKIIRAWKDADYRESLTPEEQALLPENPAEVIDLDDTELASAAGGTWTIPVSAILSATALSGCPSICAQNTICGTCAMFTQGCC